MKTILTTIALGALLGASAAHSATFGGAEVGYARDTNFNGAPDGADPLEEDIQSYTGYLGHFWPSASGRSALVLKADAQLNRFETAEVLDNTVYGGSAGIFHSFSRANSMNATLGARAKRFDDERRDGEVYSFAVGFKQKIRPQFWFQERLLLERGEAEVTAGEYNGYGISGSLNWKPLSSTLLSTSVGWTQRNYEVAVADERTNKQITLGVVQELGQHVYLRASATHQRNSANDGSDFDGNIYALGLGFSM